MKYIRHKVVAEVASPGIYYIMTVREDNGKYVAVCLQLGHTSPESDTPDEAEQAILATISIYIHDVYEIAKQGKRLLNVPSPEEYWDEFYKNVNPHAMVETPVDNFNMTAYNREFSMA